LAGIVLVNPPLVKGSGLSFYYQFEHIGLCSLAAFLRRARHGVRVIDSILFRLDVERTVDKIAAEKPFLAGFTVYRNSLPKALEIIGRLRERGIDTHVTFGGHYATFGYNEILRQPGVDSVIRGEGEYPLLDLVRALQSGEDWSTIANLASKQNGKIIANPQRPLVEDLDTLPRPARDNFTGLLRLHPNAGLPVSSSRGCYNRCAFCTISSFYSMAPGKKWRSRSPADVVDEIEAAAKKWNFRYIHFHDDCFIGPGKQGKERAYEIARELLRRKIRKPFVVLTRPDTVDKELFHFLKRAGLMRVELGVESAVQRCLDDFCKGATIKDNERAIEICRKLKIECLIFFIMFDPYMSLEEVQANHAFISRIGYESFATPYIDIEAHVGTPIRARLDRERQTRAGGSYRIADARVEFLRGIVSEASNEISLFVGEIYDKTALVRGGRQIYEVFATLGQVFIKEVFEQTLRFVEDGDFREKGCRAAYRRSVKSMIRRFRTDFDYARQFQMDSSRKKDL
jgi:anaerobic magnesium-protoporphyrin IX monomethyl ester cyclase